MRMASNDRHQNPASRRQPRRLHPRRPHPRRRRFGLAVLPVMLMIWFALMTGSTRPATSAQEAVGIMPPEPPAQNAALPVPRIRGEMLQSALQQGFGVQYWGDGYAAETLARQPHGLLIIETARIGPAHNDTGRELLFTPQEIAMISHDGARPVLGYLNLSEIEHYRDYWADHADTSPPPGMGRPDHRRRRTSRRLLDAGLARYPSATGGPADVHRSRRALP